MKALNAAALLLILTATVLHIGCSSSSSTDTSITTTTTTTVTSSTTTTTIAPAALVNVWKLVSDTYWLGSAYKTDSYPLAVSGDGTYDEYTRIASNDVSRYDKYSAVDSGSSHSVGTIVHVDSQTITASTASTMTWSYQSIVTDVTYTIVGSTLTVVIPDSSGNDETKIYTLASESDIAI